VTTKKVSCKHLSISSANIGRFSKFFHWQIRWKICNEVANKYPTTPNSPAAKPKNMVEYFTLFETKADRNVIPVPTPHFRVQGIQQNH